MRVRVYVGVGERVGAFNFLLFAADPPLTPSRPPASDSEPSVEPCVLDTSI
jgi:hypothetical protein